MCDIDFKGVDSEGNKIVLIDEQEEKYKVMDLF